MKKLLQNPWLPFGLMGLIGLHYLIPHSHGKLSDTIVHLTAGLLAILALVLHIRNQQRKGR